MKNTVNGSVTSSIVNSNYTSWDEDLVMCVTVESLSCILEINIIACQLYFNKKYTYKNLYLNILI